MPTRSAADRDPRPALPARDLADVRAADRLRGDTCPGCAAEADAERSLIDALIAEAVTDPGVRRRLDAAGGFCARHTALVPARERAKRGGTMGSAILLGAALDLRLAGLREGAAAPAGPGRRRFGLRSASAPPDPAATSRDVPGCVICVDVASAVAGLVTLLLGHAGDPAWASALAESPFCLAHLLALRDAASRAPAPVRDAWRGVAAAHIARLEAAVATADAYVQHSAHDRRSEMTDEERAAADVLVRILAGDARTA